ncbi:MAG: hypothetical protein V4574_21355 [Pseudomonadota bacterium]
MLRFPLFAATLLAPGIAFAQDHAGHAETPAPAPAPQDHSGHTMPGMDMQDPTGVADGIADPAYPIDLNAVVRHGSGTARLPSSEGAMHGVHLMAGKWMVMAHGYAWGVYTDQGGPRGDAMAFVESMAMLSAERELGGRAKLELRAMLSLEPAMGARGYPNLFATGETAGGASLVDRQHPHDLFMELSARLNVDLGANRALFVYGGPVAEPALGPSAFMHRRSAHNLPLAPITHHWFDSTHISYGVITAGIQAPRFQLEASAFRGREPDERRWNIETPKLDSWSLRASYAPSPNWLAQVSHGRLRGPEALHPGEDEARTTASIQYAGTRLGAMLAFSAKNRIPGDTLTAWLGEVNWDLSAHHSLFGRIENVANDELFPDHAHPLHDRTFRITKAEAGYAWRTPLAGDLALALGGSVMAYAKPAVLDAYYGKAPLGFTVFARLSLGD